MSDINQEAVLADLKRDEDVRLVVYDDATGKPLVPGMTLIGHPTIGIGLALDVRGITEPQAEMLCRPVISEVDADLEIKLPGYAAIPEIRRRVLVNMAFNMGVEGLLAFKNMLAAIGTADWDKAADEMENSKWYGQVGKRGPLLLNQMKTGVAS